MMKNTKITKSKPTLAKPTSRTRAKGAVSTKLVSNVLERKGKKTDYKLKPKVNVVRDSFTMPQSDYSKIAELKLACQKTGLYVKKGELLRAGLHVLEKLSVVQLKKTIAQIEHIKTGRPNRG
jgi:hypothetical protein